MRPTRVCILLVCLLLVAHGVRSADSAKGESTTTTTTTTGAPVATITSNSTASTSLAVSTTAQLSQMTSTDRASRSTSTNAVTQSSATTSTSTTAHATSTASTTAYITTSTASMSTSQAHAVVSATTSTMQSSVHSSVSVALTTSSTGAPLESECQGSLLSPYGMCLGVTRYYAEDLTVSSPTVLGRSELIAGSLHINAAIQLVVLESDDEQAIVRAPSIVVDLSRMRLLVRRQTPPTRRIIALETFESDAGVRARINVTHWPLPIEDDPDNGTYIPVEFEHEEERGSCDSDGRLGERARIEMSSDGTRLEAIFVPDRRGCDKAKRRREVIVFACVAAGVLVLTVGVIVALVMLRRRLGDQSVLFRHQDSDSYYLMESSQAYDDAFKENKSYQHK